ncbi:hypothetical protein AMS68_001076 [Peltaster fructicola]|uniref:Transcription initiation factor TFIID subunit 12 domain-containing protein n=1 Tax=Peltaster fructicola TaxID=286661 RepID=A0A6H0XLQ3_9PEZI|nr:hypothetical protein AMS68_001076 [Peltaster fructicola]
MSAPIIRPQQVDTLPFLDAQQKLQYKNGLANLWAQFEGSAEGSQARQEARQRLVAASGKIMQHISQHQRKPGAGNAAQQRPQNTQQTVQPQQPAQNQTAQTTQQPQQHAQVQQQPGQAELQDAALKQRITTEVNQITVFPLPDTNSVQQFEQYKQNFKTQLGTYKYKADKAKENQAALQRHIQQLRQQGQDISSPDIQQKAQQLKQLIDNCNRSIAQLMATNETNKQAAAARKNAQVNRQLPVNAEQARPTSQGLQDTQAAPSPAPTQTQNAQRPQSVQNQPAQPPPRPATQQAAPQQRPPINPAAAHYPSQYPNNMPPGANPASQARPHALSQQGAIARAQEQNFQQNANSQQQVQPPQSVSTGFNQVPHLTTPTSTAPNQGHGPINHKLPIPKTLPPGAQIQTPVAGAPGRPTMGHGGMLGAPGVQKIPPFQLEGEGDHVLSKRKLDELVRQVTGSADPADGLTPEVEEAVLSMTDDFVDNVITKACQMAKLRQGQTLEIRDIQLVLERNYGIRVPGYSLDEARVARKFQPGAGWIAKVQAVQAGKLMSSNRDA